MTSIDVQKNNQGIFTVNGEDLKKSSCSMEKFKYWAKNCVARFHLIEGVEVFTHWNENGEIEQCEFPLDVAWLLAREDSFASGTREYLREYLVKEHEKEVQIAKEQARAEFADVAKKLNTEILEVERLKKEVIELKRVNEELNHCLSSISKVVKTVERGNLPFS